MKEINPEHQKHLLLQQAAEKKLNKDHSGLRKKAGIFACLFLFAPTFSSGQDHWVFPRHHQQMYDLVLDLEKTQLHNNASIASPEELYTTSLAEAIELLITEDPSLLSVYESRYEDRLDTKPKSPEAVLQFLEAEMRLQWAFVYLKFGRELDAALNMKKAWEIAEQCRKKNPRFTPIRKTTGLLEIMIGSVPEKYSWVLGLLGMKGSVERGLADLEMVSRSPSSVSFESRVLLALVQGFILQEPDKGSKFINELLVSKPRNKLLSFLAASLAIKNADNESALMHIQAVVPSKGGISLFYADYLRGEIYLHKGDYKAAISGYQSFINNYRGQNFIKDAYYKTGLSFWLGGDEGSAGKYFNEAMKKGRESAEADKYAARSLADGELPNIPLSRARYFTDGGYYGEAGKELDSITPADIPSRRDQTEYYYRKARLAHRQNKLKAAKLFYRQTIEMSGSESWYFAPNSSLQMGYIAVEEDQVREARACFKKAMSYKKHEYRNSIGSKARTALAQLRRR